MFFNFNRFFVNGMCRAGNNCPYGHDMNLSNKGTIACKFYATGTCAFGDKCRFSHGDPVNSVTNSMNQLALSPNSAALNPNASAWSPGPSVSKPSGSNQAVSKPSSSSSGWPGAEFVPLTKTKKPEESKKEESKGTYFFL